jgi:hypothetical protein
MNLLKTKDNYVIEPNLSNGKSRHPRHVGTAKNELAQIEWRKLNVEFSPNRTRTISF